MSKTNKIGLIEKIVVPYLDASTYGLTNIEEIQFLLYLRAKKEQRNAAEIFKTNYTDNLDEIKKNPDYPYSKILNHLIQPEEYDSYIKEYESWLQQYQISNNLLYFLEFLVFKNKHQLRYFIKMLHKTNPPSSFLKFYFFLTLSSFTLGFLTYFEPQYLYLALDWFKYSGPEKFFWILNHILIPQNLVLISSIFTVSIFIFSLLNNLNDKTISKHEKTLKTIELTISTILNLIGQLFCLLNSGYMSPIAAYLFISSALFMACWSFLSFNRLSCPIHTQTNNFIEQVTDLSEKNFNEFKKNQFGLNSVCLILVSASTAIGLYFLSTIPAINLLAILFQFSLNMVKNTAIEQMEFSYANKTQQELYDAHESYYSPR